MKDDASVALKSVQGAYDVQDRLLRELYDVTKYLHDQTAALVQVSSGDSTTLRRVLVRQKSLATAIQAFYARPE